MGHEQFLFTLLSTVLFCLGWRIITSEGQLFYFIRKPFESLQDQIENKTELIKMFPPAIANRCALQLLILKAKLFIAKPVVLCITCMSSIWGLTIFITLNGFTIPTAPYLIINCVSAAFIQTFIWLLYEKL